MNQSKTKKLVKHFGKKEVTLLDKDNQLYMTAEEIGKALGYKQPRQSIITIYNRHKELLKPFSGDIILISPGGGGKQKAIAFNETGCYIISMKANTPKANKFVVWVAEIIKAYREGNLVKKEQQKRLPSASFLKEITKMSGVEIGAAIFLRDSIGLPLPPDTIVRNRIRTIGMTDFYLAKMYEYGDHTTRMYLEINTGKFEKKDALAAMLGLTVDQIWGER